ncbi:MAG: sulfotransferase family protein [bacterium]
MSSILKIGKSIRTHLGGLWIGEQIEHKIINSNKKFYAPPIFIVGLPRSGSTLLYQLITNYFKVSYFSNLSAFFFAYPAIITSLTLPFHKNFKIKNFESNFGFTSGLFSPSEAGAIYRYWFNGLKYEMDLIKNTTEKITDILKRPFVWKNLNLSYEIERLHKLYPDALFVFVERDLEYICQSIYRRTLNGPGLGIKGLTKNDLTKSPDIIKAIISQIKFFNSNILATLNDHDIDVIIIKYNDICKNYKEQLNNIANFYTRNGGYSLEQKASFEEHCFRANNYINIAESEWQYMLSLLNQDLDQ